MLSGSAYLWVKAVHLMAVMSWMAGLFYLPRLFVYHCQVETGSATSELFKVMERRLIRAIMIPAMTVSWVLGLAMAVEGHLFSQGWFHVKLVCVIAMTGVHFHLAKCRTAFAEDRNTRPERYFRILNEMPTLLMIAIVILAIIKP